MIVSFAAIALGMALLQSGHADLDCVLGRMSQADRALLGQEARSDNGGNGPGFELVVAATTACAAQRNWSESFSAGIAGAASGVLIGEDAEARLGRVGISVAVIDRWFDALSPAQRASALEGDSASEALVQHLLANGISLDSIEAHGGAVGQYLGALVVLERLRQGLPL